MGVGYQVKSVSGVAEHSGRNGRQCSAVAVSGEHDGVVRIAGDSSLHLGCDGVGDDFPGLVEALVHLAAVTDAAYRGEAEVQVGNPVGDVGTTPESQND